METRTRIMKMLYEEGFRSATDKIRRESQKRNKKEKIKIKRKNIQMKSITTDERADKTGREEGK